MNEGFNVAHRLIRTETMHYINASAFKGYKDAGCEEVQLWAAVDERTCHICGMKHGNIYRLKDCPTVPLHSNCRCTILPIIDKKSAKNDNINAKEDVNNEFNRRNVPEEKLKQKMKNNYDKDKLQYKKYKDILGKEAPRSFATFQELKYNDINGWEDLKTLFKDTQSGKIWLQSTFATEKKFRKHIEKHLGEFGDIKEDEYLDIARKLLSSPVKGEIEGFTTKFGFVFRYNKATNDFAIGRADGYISTLYRPVDGYEHWLEQINDYKEE